MEPMQPGALIGPEGSRAQRRAGSGRPRLPPDCAEPSASPRARDRRRSQPTRGGFDHRPCRLRWKRNRPERRIASPKDRPSLGGSALPSPRGTARGSTQPRMVDLDPLAADQGEAPVGLLKGAVRSPSPKGSLPRASPASGNRAARPCRGFPGALLPTVAFTVGRAGRFMRQLAGMRTTTPAASRPGTSFKEPG